MESFLAVPKTTSIVRGESREWMFGGDPKFAPDMTFSSRPKLLLLTQDFVPKPKLHSLPQIVLPKILLASVEMCKNIDYAVTDKTFNKQKYSQPLLIKLGIFKNIIIFC